MSYYDYLQLKKRLRKAGISIVDLKKSKIPLGWGKPCPFVIGDLIANKRSKKMRRLILTAPVAVASETYGLKRTCWTFEALMLRNGKTKKQKVRIFHDDLDNYERLTDDN